MTVANASAGPSNNTLLQALRDHTHQLHRMLDERVADRSIVTHDGYVRFLTMHARVLPTVETWLASTQEFQSIPDSDNRKRSAELARDFQLLNVPMPAPRNMSFLNETASVAGICYVLEGSRLGGAYLATLIGRDGASHPVNFLSQGRDLPLWRSFLDWLSTREQSRKSIDRATYAAEAMFDAYLAALD